MIGLGFNEIDRSGVDYPMKPSCAAIRITIHAHQNKTRYAIHNTPLHILPM
jgi:hypothetical protein